MSDILNDIVHPLRKDQVEGLIRYSISEILGEEVTERLIHDISTFSLIELRQECKTMYGEISGNGLMIRMGRAFFRKMVLADNEDSPLYHPLFRFQGLSKKIPAGLSILARILGNLSGKSVRIFPSEEGYYWEIDGCSEFSTLEPDNAGCPFQLGVLQEFMSWLGSGKMYRVDQCPNTALNETKLRINIHTQAVE